MSILLYCLGYVAVIAFVAVALMKITGYLKKPQHLRWELYPVPHEAPERAKYGGSYLEESKKNFENKKKEVAKLLKKAYEDNNIVTPKVDELKELIDKQ